MNKYAHICTSCPQIALINIGERVNPSSILLATAGTAVCRRQQMKDRVNLLLIGDSDVGKSSLISAFVSRHFPEEVPSVVHDVTVPQQSVTSGVSVTIMDSSSRPVDREVLREKIRLADCVLALYDVTRLETLDSLHQEWLPLIADIGALRNSSGHLMSDGGSGKKKKVIVVGTKTDLVGEIGGSEDLRRGDERDRLTTLYDEFPSIQMMDRCSAKLLNVDNVFYHGELVVTFPVEPLYDSKHEMYTLACRKALTRIFRVVDTDRDGLLSDQELNQLELKCFKDNLRDQEIAVVKRRIFHTVPKSVDSGRITLDGFMGLILLFIDHAQPQVPWTVLKRFGYDDNLYLEIPKQLRETSPEDVRVGHGKVSARNRRGIHLYHLCL